MPLIDAHCGVAGSVGTPVALAAFLQEIHPESFNESIIDVRINGILFTSFNKEYLSYSKCLIVINMEISETLEYISIFPKDALLPLEILLTHLPKLEVIGTVIKSNELYIFLLLIPCLLLRIYPSLAKILLRSHPIHMIINYPWRSFKPYIPRLKLPKLIRSYRRFL